MTINGIGDVAIPLAPFAIKNIPKGYRMAKTKFNNYKLAKQMNKALESPNLSFDFRINRPERFSMYSSNNFGKEIIQNIIDTNPKNLSQWRELTHKPLKTVTLKGPSFGPNGRTFKIWHPENWEWIQNQKADFGARERLGKQVEESIKKNLSTEEQKTLNELTHIRDLITRLDLTEKQIKEIYSDNPKFSKLLKKLRQIGYNKKILPPVKKVFKVDNKFNNSAYNSGGYFKHGDDELILFKPNTRAHEVAHSEYIPTLPVDPSITNNIKYVNALEQDSLPNGIFEYLFEKGNGTDSSVRASQLKNAFGLTSDEPLTPEMFDYMLNNYLKLFPDADNNMKEWFRSISYLTPENKKNFLE